jgi:hypothetical protein
MCRIALRNHRAALAAQRALWQLLLKERVRFSDLEVALSIMVAKEDQASQCYFRYTPEQGSAAVG